jgi:hypothetical protein
MQVMKVLTKTKTIVDLKAYVVKNIVTKEYANLEDCIALFTEQESAKNYITEYDFKNKHQYEVVAVKLTTILKHDTELVYVALDSNNEIIADSDSFIYAYHNLFDLVEYDREYFVIAQILEV